MFKYNTLSCHYVNLGYRICEDINENTGLACRPDLAGEGCATRQSSKFGDGYEQRAPDRYITGKFKCAEWSKEVSGLWDTLTATFEQVIA